MSKSLNRNLAELIDGTGSAVAGGLTVYATKENLPSTGLTSGDQAYVTNTSRFYISNGSGWYNVALVNANPALTISPSGVIELDNEGSATTITLTATDSDNAVAGLIFSVESDGDFFKLATLSQDSSVFTITPRSKDSATSLNFDGTSTLTFKASDGVSFGTGTSALTLTFAIQYSQYTTMLLKADTGSNDNQVDASTNSTSITEYGSVTSSAFSPYHPGGYSYYFDGTGDWITIANGSEQMVPETGDFTVEFWFYTANASTRMDPYSSYTGTTGFGIILSYGSAGTVTTYNGNTLTNQSAGGQFSANVWNHLAVSRSGTTTKIFINGTAIHTNTSDSTDYSGTSALYIGAAGNATQPYTGYLRDVRFVKGTAVYTSNFTAPSEPLTAISGTQLLACHLPYIRDGSANDYTLTVNGTPQAKRYTPYDHEGTYVKTSHGGSVHFNGTSDYLDIETSTAADFGTGDFTVEVWWYPTTPTQNGVLWAGFTNATNTSNNVCEFYLGLSTGYLRPHINTNLSGTWTTRISTTEFCYDKTWNHVAYVRNGNVGNIYINGKKGPDTAIDASAQFNNPFTALRVFRSRQTTTSYGKGYLADLRIVKGTAVYTADFTPPTAPLTAITNTEVLTMTNKHSTWDQGSGIRIKPVGTAAASNTTRKFTSSSAMYMDGNSDYFDISSSDPMVDLINFGTQDFTIEVFVRPEMTNQNYPSFISSTSGWNSGASGHRFDNIGYGTKFWFGLNGASGRNNGDPFMHSTNNFLHELWHHYAITRSGNTFRMFVNGALEDTQTYTGAYNMAHGGCRLGWATWDGGAGYFYGYIQDLRVTKGFARYTSSFTAPTATFEG